MGCAEQTRVPRTISATGLRLRDIRWRHALLATLKHLGGVMKINRKRRPIGDGGEGLCSKAGSFGRGRSKQKKSSTTASYGGKKGAAVQRLPKC